MLMKYSKFEERKFWYTLLGGKQNDLQKTTITRFGERAKSYGNI